MFYQELNKELTEKQVTLTNLFNICMKFKDPKCKPWAQVRPSSAINRFRAASEAQDMMNRKIEPSILKQVLQKLGIFIPVEEFEIILNAFKMVKNKYISYPDFIRVFVKTDYPQPFTRKNHAEVIEDYDDAPSASTKKLIFSNTSNSRSISMLIKHLKFKILHQLYW